MVLDADAQALLKQAKTLLLRGWCRYALARTSWGDLCHPNASQAAAWSLHGAVMRAAYELNLEYSFATVRDAVKDAVWQQHHLYLMWCDDSPDFQARHALALIEGLLDPAHTG